MLDCLVNWLRQLGFDNQITWEMIHKTLLVPLNVSAEANLAHRIPEEDQCWRSIIMQSKYSTKGTQRQGLSWWHPCFILVAHDNPTKGWRRSSQGRLLSGEWWTQVVPTSRHSLRPVDPRAKHCPAKNLWHMSPSTWPHLTKPGHIFVPTSSFLIFIHYQQGLEESY